MEARTHLCVQEGVGLKLVQRPFTGSRMKRLLGDVAYESKANEHGWRTKYFTARIVEVDFEAERKAAKKRGEYVADMSVASILSYMRNHVDVGAWKHGVVESCPTSGTNPVDWLLKAATKHRVYNLKAVKKLCATGSILNVLEPEHQMAYQFSS